MRCAVVVSVQCRSFYKHSRRRTANHHPSKDDWIARVGVCCHQRVTFSDVQPNRTTKTAWLYSTKGVLWILEGAQKQWEEIIYIDSLGTRSQPRIGVVGFNVQRSLDPPLETQSSALILRVVAVKLWWPQNEVSSVKLLKVLLFLLLCHLGM